jgi:hypothetical protein
MNRGQSRQQGEEMKKEKQEALTTNTHRHQVPISRANIKGEEIKKRKNRQGIRA